mmetsp:Transcript_81178/g.263081  ORF Transcript_81178/g.263081 Transcript_81178/m.263081 type:complete len:204 (+) Transcript_81178:1576-2187(+)
MRVDSLIPVWQHKLPGVCQREQRRQYFGRNMVHIFKHEPPALDQSLCDDAWAPNELADRFPADICSQKHFDVCLLVAEQKRWLLLAHDLRSSSQEGRLSRTGRPADKNRLPDPDREQQGAHCIGRVFCADERHRLCNVVAQHLEAHIVPRPNAILVPRRRSLCFLGSAALRHNCTSRATILQSRRVIKLYTIMTPKGRAHQGR